MLNAKAWQGLGSFQSVTYCRPHLSILESLVIENERALPQQALSTITNVDDIESHIRKFEKLNDKTFLSAFDIDHGEREKILRELGLMGITPATLFPGIQGACEDMKNRMFGL
jgi:hypothetical protein